MGPISHRVGLPRSDGPGNRPNSSLGQQLGNLSVTAAPRRPQAQANKTTPSRNRPTSLTVAASSQEATNGCGGHIFNKPSMNGRGNLPPSSASKRNVKAESKAARVNSLDWLPSTNYGDQTLSMRVTAEMAISPSGGYLIGDIHKDHNRDVPPNYPRMRVRELDSIELPGCWELIPLGSCSVPPMAPEASGKFLLRTPQIKISKPERMTSFRLPPRLQNSEYWLDYFEATGQHLLKNYGIHGVRGDAPILSICISTQKKALDFKRIVQSLVYFNILWPKVLANDNRSPEEIGTPVVEHKEYISHNTKFWSANPITGEIFIYVNQPGQLLDKNVVLWTQFAINLVLAATKSPSYEFIAKYPVTMQGLNEFMIMGPFQPDDR